MSGFEIAGVVLASIPLLIEGGKAMAPLLEKSEFWWKFQEKFSDMLDSLETQQMRFRQTLKLLLQPLDLDADIEDGLLKDPRRSSGWNDPYLHAKLSKRIGSDAYQWFMKGLRSLDAIIVEIMSIMPIADGKVRLPVQGTTEVWALRWVVSFSGKRKRLEKFAEINKELLDHLTTDLVIAQAYSMRSTIMAKEDKYHKSKRVRPFLALQSHVRALCSAFSPKKWTCGCQKAHSVAIATRLEHGSSSSRGVQLWMGSKLVNVEFPCDVPESQHADTAFTSVQESTRAVSLLAREQHAAASKPKKSKGAMATFIEVTTKSILSPPNTPAGSPRRSTRLFKRVQFGGATQSTTAATASVQSTQPAQVQLGCTLIASPTVPGGQINLANQAIILSVDTGAARPSSPQTSSTQRTAREESLEVFYKSTPQLDQRIRLGIKLAYTILSLGTSPWIPGPTACGANDLLVLRVNGSANAFLFHESIRLTLDRQIPEPRPLAEMAVFMLGVIFLQLIFQERLEAQPFYRKHCPSGTRTNPAAIEKAALEWHRDVEPQHGAEIAGLILYCLTVRWRPEPNLAKEDFLDEVLTTVVEPLEEYVLRWTLP